MLPNWWKEFFIQGRRREVPLLWLSVPGANIHGKPFGSFLRKYILAVIGEEKGRGEWRSLDSLDPLAERDVRLHRDISSGGSALAVGEFGSTCFLMWLMYLST